MIGGRLGNWVIDEELGQGGMGCVYLAHEVAAEPTASGAERRAAIKVLSRQLSVEPGFLSRFQREIEALRRLKHPNIVQFFDAGEDHGAYYYAMEYVEGSSFDELLDEAGRMPWDEVLTLTLQICSALKHAHDHGIIHRDIKPTNLILNTDGLVKLVDFGVAKVFANSPLTATDAVVGTADYMSPEQAAGKPVTRRSDLYSLGVVMYKMVTGRTPFQASSALEMLHQHLYGLFDPPRKRLPDVPHAFDALICRLLEKDPEKRPPDALVLSRELEGIRRRMAQQSRHTTDPAHTGATIVDQQGEAVTHAPSPGPATLMSQLVRKELEELNREGPISRMLNRAWLLILLLVAVTGLLIYGLWPKSAATLLEEAEKLVARADYRAAAARLDRLEERDPPLEIAQRAAELRRQIEEAQVLQQARRGANSSSAGLNPPASEAERFYREALQDYQSGRAEQARLKWQRLVDAFSGVEADRRWVLLAQDALKKAGSQPSDLAAVEAAIRLAKTEPRDQGEKRLKALAELYADRQDATGQAARARIAETLRELGAQASDGK
jgi:serine/threonine-protein kinase